MIAIAALLAGLVVGARVGWHLASAQRTLDRLLDLDDHTIDNHGVAKHMPAQRSAA